MRIPKYSLENAGGSLCSLHEDASYQYSEKIDGAVKVVDMVNALFRLNTKSEEHIVLLALNAALDTIGIFELSHGTIDSSLFSVGAITTRLLLCGAAGFIVAHNHPSGHHELLSRDDEKAIEQLKKVQEIFNVRFHDFIVISRTGFRSCREDGTL